MYDLFNPLSMDVDNPWRTNNHCRFTSEPVQVRAVAAVAVTQLVLYLHYHHHFYVHIHVGDHGNCADTMIEC
jgi:hypothetical protein